MSRLSFEIRNFSLLAMCCVGLSLLAQTQDNPPRRDGDRPPAGETPSPEGRPNLDGPPPFGQRGPGGPGRGGFGVMMQEETKLVKQFDKDGDKRLNAAERKAARDF